MSMRVTERFGVIRMPTTFDVVDHRYQDEPIGGYRRVSRGHPSSAAAWRVADGLNKGRLVPGTCPACGEHGVVGKRCRACREVEVAEWEDAGV